MSARRAPGGLWLLVALALLAAPHLGPARAEVAGRSPAARAPAGPVCPVAGGTRVISGWGDPRDGGRRHHQGVDLAAPVGRRLVAVAAGRIWRTTPDVGRGGITVSLVDGRGVRAYYAHLSSVAVHPGQRVRAGQLLGRAGTTGNARGTAAPHLHFGMSTARGWFDPGPAVRRWCR